MKFWWMRDLARLAAEKEAVETAAANEGWFSLERWSLEAGLLTARGVIRAHGHAYAVRLVYPDQFPEVPAWVQPQEAVQWSVHQYGPGGTLCLELRPDNWHPSASGADVLRSAYNLLSHENPLGGGGPSPAPSAHRVGQVQSYDWGAPPVLLSAGCHDRLLAGTTQELRALRWPSVDGAWTVLVHDGVDATSARRPPPADWTALRLELPVYVSPCAPPQNATCQASVFEAGGLPPDLFEQTPDNRAALVFFIEGTVLTAFLLHGDNRVERRSVFVLPNEDGVRSGRPAASAAKRVALIGLGSVGSKLVESLARSGISRFRLFDGDVMLPGNLERNALDWRDVGLRKVRAVERRLLNIVPGAKVSASADNLNWQRSARTHAWQVAAVAECDVVVDASGDTATSLFLGAVAAANGRAFVSVEVYEGGLGASVASCVPGLTPAYAPARAAFLAWCDERAVAPPKPGPRNYEALADDGSPIAADDAAATTAAGHAARVVLDILDGHPPGPEAGWMLFGFRAGWVFRCHGDNVLLNVGLPSTPQRASQNDDARAFVKKLVEECLGEAATGE